MCVTNSVNDIISQNEGLGLGRTITIYNGIDAEFKKLTNTKRSDLLKELNLSIEDKIIGFVANFNWIKGHDVFIQSAQEVANKLRSIQRRAINYGKSRDELLSDIGLYIEDMEALANRIDAKMEQAA